MAYECTCYPPPPPSLNEPSCPCYRRHLATVATCRECGHLLGWHFRGAGSCLECSCLGPTPTPPESDDGR